MNYDAVFTFKLLFSYNLRWKLVITKFSSHWNKPLTNYIVVLSPWHHYLLSNKYPCPVQNRIVLILVLLWICPWEANRIPLLKKVKQWSLTKRWWLKTSYLHSIWFDHTKYYNSILLIDCQLAVYLMLALYHIRGSLACSTLHSYGSCCKQL